ncbi:MAG: aspartate aminotransferase family protein [Dehalococcoidia bacterium]
MSVDELIASAGVSDRKAEILRINHEYVMPNRVESWLGAGIPMVIGKREGYRIWDVDGQEFQDFHLNGGTYNLGHRHPALLDAMREALETLDVGNHHFPSEARGVLAEKLAKNTPGDLHYTVLTPSGSEANDLAVKSARHATGRRKVVSFENGYHGASGLSGALGESTIAQYFNSAFPDDFIKIPFNDLDALEDALKGADVAAFMIEPLPATFGFPVPDDGYFPGVRKLCDDYGTLLIADEVQTGLGRSGSMWAVEKFGVQPDMLVTGKGISGGLYPIGCLVLTKEAGSWIKDNGWGYSSTFGGSEIACHIASRAIDITTAPETAEAVRENATYMRRGLDSLQDRYPFLTDIRQLGVIFGLGFDGDAAGMLMTRSLYKTGLWAMFAGFDRRYLQFKLGLLVDKPYCDEALEKLETALKAVTP